MSSTFTIDHTQAVLDLEISWIALSGMATAVALFTVVSRSYSHLKCIPTDDSFRVTIVFKVLLLGIKAALTALVQDDSTQRSLVSISYVISLLLTGFIVLSVQIFKVWRHSALFSRVVYPKAFIVTYCINFLMGNVMAAYVLIICLEMSNKPCSLESDGITLVLAPSFTPALLLLYY
jgi:hypothetical protein